MVNVKNIARLVTENSQKPKTVSPSRITHKFMIEVKINIGKIGLTLFKTIFKDIPHIK